MATMITLSGTLKQVCDETMKRLDHGYKIAKEWSHIDWPYFWRRKYYINIYRADPGETMNVYVNGIFIGSSIVRDSVTSKDSNSLQSQLHQALEQEDYETAARLRDLINKK